MFSSIRNCETLSIKIAITFPKRMMSVVTFQHLLLKLGRRYGDDRCAIRNDKRWDVSALLESQCAPFV